MLLTRISYINLLDIGDIRQQFIDKFIYRKKKYLMTPFWGGIINSPFFLSDDKKNRNLCTHTHTGVFLRYDRYTKGHPLKLCNDLRKQKWRVIKITFDTQSKPWQASTRFHCRQLFYLLRSITPGRTKSRRWRHLQYFIPIISDFDLEVHCVWH